MDPADGTRQAFERIYRDDAWDGGSGPGSLPSSTTAYRAFVETFIHENRIGTVTDLGCGDWQFSRFVNWGDVHYIGLDVVPDLVDRNMARFGSDRIEFRVSDGPASLPGGDLILCKEVLQHLPNQAIFDYLEVIKGLYRYALITNSVSPGHYLNRDIDHGGYRPLRIDRPPFNAIGAHVLTYISAKSDDSELWKNSVFLMCCK